MARLDRTGRRQRWTKARAAEIQYNSRLRSVARHVGALVRGLAQGTNIIQNPGALIRALEDYAVLIGPWAQSVAAYMLADVERRDKRMWRTQSAEMGTRLRDELLGAPTGDIMRQLQAQQVELIRSIPLEAAKRVHHLTSEAIIKSQRASVIQAEILRTEAVSINKARLIARTEVSRAASNLVEARATYAGSDGYFWRTSDDSDVRDSHRHMEGKYVRWSAPPTLDGMKGHAGTLPNCRCFAEPHFTD